MATSPFEAVPTERVAGTVFDDVNTPNSVPAGSPALPNKTLLMALANVNTDSNPDLQMQGEALDIARNTIETGQEMTERNKIAAQRAIRQMAGLQRYRMANDGIMTPQQSAAIDTAYNNVAAWDQEQKARTALEDQAVDNITDMAARDPVQAQVLMDNLQHGGAEQVRHDNLVKMSILAQRAEELDFEHNQTGWGKTVLNFALNLVPLNYNFQRSGLVGGTDAGVMDWLLSGEGIRKQSEKMYQMSPEEFAVFAAKDGPLMQSIRSNATTLFGLTNDSSAAVSLLHGLSGQSAEDRVWADSWGVADPLTVVPFGKIGGITKSLGRAGARTEKIALLSKAAETLEREGPEAMARETAVTTEELKAAESISAVDPSASSSHSVPVALDLATREKAAREAIAKLSPILQETERLHPDELMQAYDDAVDAASVDYGTHIKDTTALQVETLANGNTVSYVEFVFGKKSGGGYAKEATAVNAAQSRGLSGEAFRDETGQWFVRGRKNIAEQGYATDELHNPTQGFVSQITGRWVRSASRVTDYLMHGKAVQSGSTIGKAQKVLGKEMDAMFKSIPHESQEIVQQVALVGANKGKWWSADEFNTLVERGYGRQATPKELEAYQNMQLYNDIDWVFRNDQMYLEKATRGVESVGFNTSWGQRFDLEGVVKYNPKVPPPVERVWNLSDNIHYTAQNNPLTGLELERLVNNGYIITKTEKAIKLPDGTTVDHVIGKRTDFEIGALDRTQLAYSEGGHRLYPRGSYFIKQASVGKQADTGTEFLENPNVYATAVNKAEAQAWADVMEKARLGVKDAKYTAQELDDLVFEGRAGFVSGQEFLDGIKNGSINLNHPFEAVFDREMPSAYKNAGPNASLFVSEDELGFNGYYRTTGKLFTSSKGEILRDTTGEIAVTVDPYEALSTSLRQITRQSGLFNYRQESLERFINSFKEDLANVDPRASNYANFVSATVKPGTSVERRNFIEAQRAAMKNVFGFETEFEKGMKEAWRHSAEQILGDGTNAGRKAVHDTINWWSQKNPVSFLRGLAFDAKLGLFNVGQFFIQSSTMASAVALSPKMGLKGMMSAMPLHGYLLSKGSETVLDSLAKKGVGKLSGFASEQEFKEYARTVYRSGFMDLNGSHIMVGENGPAAVYGSFGDKAHRARETGRMFFYAAETYNRLVAYRIAWDEVVSGGLKPGASGFYGKVAARADDYSLNMTHESAARWQKGLLSIPTQFWAYNVRMMDAMVGKRFTAAQRMRLVGMNFALAGTAGIPIVEGISSMIKDHYGVEADIDTMMGTLDRGILDKLAYEFTGADVRIGEKIGTGGWLTNTIRDAFGTGEYGERSWAEIMGGATFSILKSAGETGIDLLKYTTAESGADMGEDGLREEEFLKLASEISTFGNISKAILAGQYGIYKSKNGTIYPGLPKTDAFYIALGFKPQQIDTLAHMSKYTKNQDEVINDASNQIRKWRQEAFYNEDMMDKNARKANALIRMLPAHLRTKVLKKANQGDNKDLFTHIEEKFNKQIAEEGTGSTNDTAN